MKTCKCNLRQAKVFYLVYIYVMRANTIFRIQDILREALIINVPLKFITDWHSSIFIH